MDKNSKRPKIVVCTHGFVKKDWKVSRQELEKALKAMKCIVLRNREERMKKYSLEELTDKYVGQAGTSPRERFDFELRADILGEIIKNARLEQNLTQEQLGKLIGVQKAQISKIENNAKDVRFSTILRVFEALKAQVNISVKLPNHEHVQIA